MAGLVVASAILLVHGSSTWVKYIMMQSDKKAAICLCLIPFIMTGLIIVAAILLS